MLAHPTATNLRAPLSPSCHGLLQLLEVLQPINDWHRYLHRISSSSAPLRSVALQGSGNMPEDASDGGEHAILKRRLTDFLRKTEPPSPSEVARACSADELTDLGFARTTWPPGETLSPPSAITWSVCPGVRVHHVPDA
ncbi:uncharacterized protein MYCFIDRAFT_174983 [Pseudocercospora fijiensis CIRAD86]|uniref:Uncharacterized protein n=1 Tax=Pseudocercospora fijiensis (strain CIRAD86) TaxID=383855 RepID=M3B2C1_PSEFD|nr:uncharacterized protein MYCFIDRAFT_174983 [Pseudocercospora fijiensis CIRAD86]EME83557.1 hypothetical protein MYCFIDRAFT_174983 [Pseudocercospora fijiensis CIRAD86]